MTTHRRYNYQYPKQWTESGRHAQIKQLLQHACEKYWWFNEPEVTGEPLGYLSFSFTVSARDQWWCHRRAMRLATDCFYAIGMTEQDMPEPVWETLEPHTNRGRYRIPGDGL